MEEVAFVTDTTCNLPDEMVRRLGLTVVPVYVIFGGDSYKDYVEMPPGRFYSRLAQGGPMPTTSQPTPEDFRRAYERCKADGARQVISVHVSAKSSGTCNSARLAASMVPDLTVHVVDSGTTSILMGWMVEAAQRALAAGQGIAGALEAIEEIKARSALLFTVTEVEHLKASGRTEGSAKVTDAPLKMKPIVAVDDGVPKVVGQARTQGTALDSILEIARVRAGGQRVRDLGVVHGNVERRAQEFARAASEALNYDGPVPIMDFGPALAVHFGPGLLGLALHWE